MKVAFLILYSVFLSFSAAAQRLKISLAGQRTSKPIPNLEIEDVIDLRLDKTNIGWVQKGMNNTRIHADLAVGLKEELQWFLKMNAATGGNKIPVIVKVNKIAITERTIGDREYATAEVALEFLMQEYGKTDYCLLLQAGSSVESSSMTDVTGGHAYNLARALEDCFLQASNLKFKNICASSAAVPASHLNLNTYYNVDPQTIPILASAAPKSGVYLNFKEFKNNDPGLLESEVVFDKGRYLVDAYSGKKIKDSWGFSDGQQTYIRFGGEQNFFPLTKQKDHFSFEGNVISSNAGAIVLGSLVGGIAGGLIAGALTEKTQVMKFTVNPLTGIISPAENFGPDADKNKTGKIVIYRNNKSELPQPLKILINDSLAAELPVNSVSEFNFKIPVSETDFCLQAGGNTCQKLTPVIDRVLYFECGLPAKGTRKPFLKPATAKEADYYLKIIKHTQNKQAN